MSKKTVKVKPLKYIKLKLPTQVNFASDTGVIPTLEGGVSYKHGDALMKGVNGEHWPISKATFELTYEPVSPSKMGDTGTYVKKRIVVEAVQKNDPFEIVIHKGESILKGNAGDWVVMSDVGESWVVADSIFKETYRLKTFFERHERNLLVAGHRFNRLPQDKIVRDRVFASLDGVIEAFRIRSDQYDERLHILTGFSEGSDEKSAEIANKYGISLHVIAACQPQNAHKAYEKAERISLLINKCDYPSEKLIAASDEAKLALADAMVIIWDGKAPHGYSGGTVRLMIDAIRRFTPVIWVDARSESAGQILCINSSLLDAPTLAMLDVEENNVEQILQLFTCVDGEINIALNKLIVPLWNTSATDEFLELLNQGNTDPKNSRTLVGIVHTWFLKIFGYGKQKKFKPVQAYRGPKDFVEAAGLPNSTWDWFDHFDRIATHAANHYRDQIILIHLLSSLAVLGAIAGAIDWLSLGGINWGLFELGTLVGIGVIFWKDQHSLLTSHSLWMNCRQLAEAIRTSAIIHPMQANLSILHRGIWQPQNNSNPKLAKPYRWLIIQLLREAGAPNDAENHCIETKFGGLSKGLKALIQDQIKFHKGTYERNNNTHHRMHGLTKLVFFIVLATVIVHLFALIVHFLEHRGYQLNEVLIHLSHWIHLQNWLLLFTAFFPALAAGLHGIMTKLELQRVADSSNSMNEILEAMGQAVERLKPEEGSLALRKLAIETAEAMFAEHDSWAELMETQNLEIPA